MARARAREQSRRPPIEDQPAVASRTMAGSKKAFEVEPASAPTKGEKKRRANDNISPMSWVLTDRDLSADQSTTSEDEAVSPTFEMLAMSGADMPPLKSSDGRAFTMTSPSRKMSQKIMSQKPDQLYKHSRLWVQVAVPVCIVLTIGLFLWSNLSVGASVMLAVKIPDTAANAISFTQNIPPAAGETLELESLGTKNTSLPRADEWVPNTRVATICMFTSSPMRCMGQAIVTSLSNTVNTSGMGIKDTSPENTAVEFPIFNFTLVSAVRKMWEGQAYALAFLIAALSGAWPYIKLVSMLVLWFVPCKPRIRESLLSLLEALGKWSLIDIYVFALMMAGFRFTLNVGAIATIRIAIEAKWGIFSFCIGVIASHLLSHLMMFVHHNSQAGLMGLPESKRHFSLSSVARIRHRKLNVCSQLVIAFLILIALAFTVSSTCVKTFKFTFYGLVGMMLPPDQQETMFSLVEAGAYIPSILEGLPLSTRIGEYFVVVVYYAFAFVTPIMKVVSCLVLWSVPLTTHQKQVAKTVTSLFGTWSALDVFFVSVIAAIIEIGSLTSSIMGEVCDSLKATLGIECLRLEASFLPGAWLMGVAVIVSFIVSRLILTSAAAHFRRIAMLHLWTLKKRLFESRESATTDGGEASDEKNLSTVDSKVIATYSEELFQKKSLSTKFANLLAGSVHESQIDLQGLSPDEVCHKRHS